MRIMQLQQILQGRQCDWADCEMPAEKALCFQDGEILCVYCEGHADEVVFVLDLDHHRLYAGQKIY